MPNWSQNTLTVTGTPAEVANFVEQAKGENGALDFNKFIQMPEELKNTEQVYYGDPELNAKQEAIYASNEAKYGFESWYDWACEKWNTKWNAGEIDLDLTSTKLVSSAFYIFQTAWDAPLPVIEKMSKDFPRLHFSLTADEESGEYYYEKNFFGGEEIEHIDLEREEGWND
jgi:hypothetical protein